MKQTLRNTASCYVSWEEVNTSNDKGRREVHYYLKTKDGCSSDLVVIGKEKSSRHMFYHYVISNKSSTTSLLKLKSRQEVVDWLNSIISGLPAQERTQSYGGLLGGKEGSQLDLKDVQLQKLGHCTEEFSWLGSSWISRKRRNHYRSFCRNGVKISVHDFVYVLAEENKRLVAYLEDMYEDARGNKMVVVRWFHKIDEVGICLPHTFNDREIFFSLCLQDLSIECIDGLATVLSPQHFEKFQNVGASYRLQPFICDKQFKDDDVKPFDVTQVKGYWKQEIIKCMFTLTSLKDYSNSRQSCTGQRSEKNATDVVELRLKKRRRQSKDDNACEYISRKESMDASFMDSRISSKSSTDLQSGTGLGNIAGVGSVLSSKKEADQNSQYLKVGSHVEILSQDSGIRGCWYRALVIKKHKDKVKVRYSDVPDAADEAYMLEEWVLASRVAVPDQLGLRLSGRRIVRPSPEYSKGRVSWAVDVGTAVDVWWHDGWWEGIVVQKDSEDKFHVFFPGEKQKSVFGRSDLRHSQEWLGNRWMNIKDRPNVVSSILSSLGTKQTVEVSCDGNSEQAAVSISGQLFKNEIECSESISVFADDSVKTLDMVLDLAKDDLLAQLKWSSSRKRRRTTGSSVHKLHYCHPNRKNTRTLMGSGFSDRFLIPASIKVDHDNCKYMGDPLFNSSAVPPLTNLVMSR